MTDEEIAAAIEAEIDTKLAAELEARKAQMRADIAMRLRHEAAMRHLDRVNARAPIENQFSGLTREQHEARLRLMDERRAAESARLDKINARSVPGARASLRTTAADGAGGGSSFRIKG
jgi:hypothetical protein